MEYIWSTDEFGDWYATLIDAVQDDIVRVVGLVEAKGPQLPFPYPSGIEGSKHEHMQGIEVSEWRRTLPGILRFRSAEHRYSADRWK